MLLELEEKTTEYYIVVVDRDEYPGVIGSEPWTTIDAWCTQTFGEQGVWGAPASTWKRMGPSYFFQHDKDRALFALRWQ